jgi:GDP-D-mannose dehydratase
VHRIKRRAPLYNTARVDHLYEDRHVENARFKLHYVGDVIVRIDPRYFRPAEVDTLLGDPAKAKQLLGWVPEITVQEMCAEMVAEDHKAARRVLLLREHGLELPVSLEG